VGNDDHLWRDLWTLSSTRVHYDDVLAMERIWCCGQKKGELNELTKS